MEWCVEELSYICQITCNDYECQDFTEYSCSFAPVTSVDACIANVEQVCQNNTGKGKGKGFGKGIGNTTGEFSCSLCQAIVSDACEFIEPEDPEHCVKEGDLACQAACNDNECQKFAEYFCSFAPAASVDACIAAVEQGCLENNRKGFS